MESILQGLMGLPGVRAAMVLDGGGQVVAHCGQAVYDRALCEQVGAPLTRAIESIQLQQEDWETVSAQFGDGKILVRRVSRAEGARHVVAMVADGTLNASFATVALRVATNKVRAALDGTPYQSSVVSRSPGGSQALGPVPAATSSAAPLPPPSDSRPVLAHAGTSWSKVGGGSSALGGSSVLGSAAAAADPASSSFLVRCAKEMARHVGPMSKVYVQEAVRRVSPDAPFALSSAGPLVDDLSSQIEDPKDRAAFRKALLEHK